jgi:hypothetical protein
MVSTTHELSSNEYYIHTLPQSTEHAVVEPGSISPGCPDRLSSPGRVLFQPRWNRCSMVEGRVVCDASPQGLWFLADQQQHASAECTPRRAGQITRDPMSSLSRFSPIF